jgi:DNA (cytosine-5)-methyltransferase 1
MNKAQNSASKTTKAKNKSRKINKLKFIDLFAGIGGFRLALEELGAECVFSSEWDENAKNTYETNFGERPHGDITKINEKDIPDHDILCAGFPCQPFSLAGVSSRNALNRSHGFECETQGNLFFDIVRIAKEKKPKVLFLENVKNLVSHDGGNTIKVIKDEISKLGYSFSIKVINANTEVPQSRVRAYMVCVSNGAVDFKFPDFSGNPIPLKTILEKKVDSKFTISDKLWEGHQRRTSNNLARGTGFSAFLADVNKPANTIVARYGKDGKECLIPQKDKNPRMLTPRECASLQGFPKTYKIPESRSIAYKQFGNSVAVPVIRKIAGEILLQCF